MLKFFKNLFLLGLLLVNTSVAIWALPPTGSSSINLSGRDDAAIDNVGEEDKSQPSSTGEFNTTIVRPSPHVDHEEQGSDSATAASFFDPDFMLGGQIAPVQGTDEDEYESAKEEDSLELTDSDNQAADDEDSSIDDFTLGNPVEGVPSQRILNPATVTVEELTGNNFQGLWGFLNQQAGEGNLPLPPVPTMGLTGLGFASHPHL